MKKFYLLFILLVTLSGCYSKGVIYDEYEPDSTYLVVQKNMSVSSPWVQNFSLPKTVTSYILSDFTYSDGTVKMNNEYQLSNAYRGNRKIEDINGYSIYEIPFTDDFKNLIEMQITGSMDAYDISFSLADLFNNENKLLYQPSAFALIKGIQNSKKSSGQACLFELIYNGNGKFNAKVGIK
jgi:hypothetical protein